MLTRAKIMSALKGEWAALNLFDKSQLVLMVGGLGWGAYAVAPELALLQDIAARLGPKVEVADVVYVSRASHDGQAISIELQKVRTENQLQYDVWMCDGEGGKKMTYFGSGHMGTEENTVRLTAHTPDAPREVIVNFHDGRNAYTRRENWDLYQGVKASATVVVPGTIQCGEA
jgi:hypothetical protein